MVSQAAQTNGVDGKRRLVKSLSEAARYEGMDFEIYDLDGLPTPPPPPAKSIPQVLPLYPKEHSIWNFHPYSHTFHPLHNGESSESIKSEVIHRCKCYTRSDSPKDILICSPSRSRRFLTKTMSEGEILLDKRKALSMATGYMDVDINGHRHEEDVIEPHCVNECSYDLSHTRIFSQESLGEDTDEDVFHEHLLCSNISRQPEEQKLSFPEESDLKAYESHNFKQDFKNEHNFIDKLKSKQLEEINLLKVNTQSSKVQESPTSDTAPTEEVSPVEASCMTDISSTHEIGDHLEESVSESQVTVLQKLTTQSGASPHCASDSENGSFHLTDISSTATTPSTKHKSTPIGESFDEDLEEETQRFRFTSVAVGGSNLSSISDEQTSISENVISDSSQVGVSLSLGSGDVITTIAEPISNKITYNQNNDTRNKEKIIEKIVQELQEGDFVASIHARLNEVRKIASPESDSSSSHFTEQETSRSPASAGTNTITSKSDLSRTDSHTNTDQSETSEDYMTATENSTEILETRRILLAEERHVSSPPRLDYILEDEALSSKFISPGSADTASNLQELHEISECSSIGIGHTNDFDTAQDLTSPDGDTTTSASYHIEIEEGGSIVSQLDNFSSSPKNFSPLKVSHAKKNINDLEGLDIDNEDIKTINKIKSTKSIKCDISKVNKQEIEAKMEPIKKIYVEENAPKDSFQGFSKFTEEKKKEERKETSEREEENLDPEITRRQSLTEEEREKLKSEMKLNFPPGVTMYGPNLEWDETDSKSEDEKNKSEEIKSKKLVKMHATSDSDAVVSTDIVQEKQKRDKQSEARTWNEKVKRQSEEITTPGMVRSPAMHEGFRLEEWTPIRTPSTPETFLGIDTSDESYDEEKVLLKGIKLEKKSRERSRASSGITEDKISSKAKDTSLGQYDRKKENYKKSLNDLENSEKSRKSLTSSHEKLQSSLRPEKMNASHIVIETAHPPSKSSIVYPGDVRRRSGDLSVGFWSRNSKEGLRADERLLGPGDNLRKADSLRSFSPGSDNVFLGGSNEQIDGSRMHLCLQVTCFKI